MDLEIFQALIPEQNGLTFENRRKRQIRMMLVSRGLSQKEIASRYNIHAADVCRVINGDRKTPRIRKILAQELGLDYQVLWFQQEKKS